jgi:SAM-dependent methyltransferase
MTDALVDVRKHNADYGYDGNYQLIPAPAAAALTGLASATLLTAAARQLARGKPRSAAVTGAAGALIATTAALFIHTTRVGKFAVWAELLDGLDLRGDEKVLDLGCGRGAVLLAAAKLVPNGRATGVDIWRADQTDNSQDNTLRNAVIEGVADRVEVHTANITALPFDDNSFDVITSSLVIHNIPDQEGREKAIAEAVRVLRPGGRMVLVDLRNTGQYAHQLQALGCRDVVRGHPGGHMLRGPGLGMRVVTATKPA